MDPHSFYLLDPDLHSEKLLDPHKMNVEESVFYRTGFYKLTVVQQGLPKF